MIVVLVTSTVVLERGHARRTDGQRSDWVIIPPLVRVIALRPRYRKLLQAQERNRPREKDDDLSRFNTQ